MAVDRGDVKFTLAADDSQVVAALNGLKAHAGNAASSLQGAFAPLTDSLKSLQGQFIALAAVVGGGAYFKKMIDVSTQLTGESMKLSRMLGITGQEASILNTALGDIYTSADDYIDVFTKFSRQLKTNEDGLQGMGLKTRDANGHLRDSNTLFKEALSSVSTYKSGLDQNTYAQTVFGKSIEDVMKLQKLNNDVLEEARQKNEDLGLTITQDNVAASKAYKAAMNDVGDVLSAISKVIGDSVMPIFTDLANYFASTGPYVVGIFKGALMGLTTVFYMVKATVKSLAGAIFESINTIIDSASLLSEVLIKVIKGDYSGAYDAGKRLGQRFSQGIRNVIDNNADVGAEAVASIKKTYDNLFGERKGFDQPKSGTRRRGDLKDTPAAKEKPDPSAMPTYEAALEERRLAYAKENNLREMSKQQELDWWREVLATYEVSGKDKTAIVLKTAKLELDILRQAGKDKRAIDLLYVEDQKAQALDQIDLFEETARVELDRGTINNAQYLERRAAFNEMRLQAELEFINKKIEIAQLDPENNLVALEQLEMAKLEIKRRYAALANKINLEKGAEQFEPFKNIAESIGAGFSKVGQTLLTNWRNVGNVLKGVLASIGQTIIQETILKPLAAKVVAWAKERLLTMAGIGASAAEAGAGAAKSQAGIPIAGPWLALAAMATVFAGVMGMGAKVPSAAKGFDIPRGMNPMTQLHEQEMVLPQQYANVIRDLAGGVGGAGQGNAAPIQIATTGGDWIHKRDLASLLTKMHRNFEFVK